MRITKINSIILVSIVLSVFLFSCRKKDKQIVENKNLLFELMGSDKTGIQFENKLISTDSVNIFTFTYIYNGSGVAVGDINNDGLPDIYFSGNQVSGRLYLNKGNFKFEDITQKAGVSTSQWCTGVAMADVNNDGFLDIYICKSGKFNAPEKRRNILFINNKNGTFTEQAHAYGLDNDGFSTSATFFDMDNDGDLDVYLANEFVDPFEKAGPLLEEMGKYTEYSTPRLFENIGNGFKDISQKAGILAKAFNLSVTAADFNKDGYVDLNVCNDFYMPDRYLINNRNKMFVDSLKNYFKHTSSASMGSDVADFNNDGFLDIVSVDMLAEDNHRQKIMSDPSSYDAYHYFVHKQGYGFQENRNNLQLNNGNGSFSEIGYIAGVAQTDWSWAPLMADFDNDGNKDLFVSNGFRKDFNDKDFVVYRSTEIRKKGKATNYLEMIRDHMPEEKIHNYVFQNNGNLLFSNKSEDWGLTQKSFSYGAAYADLDGDGDLDLLVCNTDDKPFVYKNISRETKKSNFLQMTLKGEESNRFGMGCKITITTSKGKQFIEHTLSRGFQSTVQPLIHFGLGKDTVVQSVEVVWPSGKVQHLNHVAGNTVLHLDEKDAIDKYVPNVVKPNYSFREKTAQLGTDYTHKENDYIDFKREPLVPHKCSQNGPGIAVGDVNGDGLDDYFIGAAQYSGGGTLYLQKKDGAFMKASSQIWSEDAPGSEDLGSIFFDADHDGDNDLYVVSGGSEYDGNSSYYQDRLYLNDGKGNFKREASALPEITSSGSCVTACDYDQDGDLDLFVGGRIFPGKYPLPARSYILQNNGGKFLDVTEKVCKNLVQPGLVTNALWTDFDNDALTDLIVVGEWMPISFYKNNGKGLLIDVTTQTGLIKTNGWWNSITGGDFDNDGDIDYIAGNQGLNTKVVGRINEPITLNLGDFDQNKSLDAILCYYVQGKSYPVASRDQMASQLRAVRKQFLKYHDYADKTIEDIFSKESLDKSKVFYAYNFQSSYIENKGKGKFAIHNLPVRAQLSSVFGQQVLDINHDGNLDVLLVGNSYSPQVEIGFDDAFYGHILLGDGKGNFSDLISAESGFNVPGEGKSLAKIYSGNKTIILVGNNNGKMQSFELMTKESAIVFEKDDIGGEIEFKNGKKRKFEFYIGEGYLSQSSKIMDGNTEIKSIKVINNKHITRTLDRF